MTTSGFGKKFTWVSSDMEELPDEFEPIEEGELEPTDSDIEGLFHFAEEDPNLRTGGGDYEDATNKLQNSLLSIYDRWAIDTRNQILAAQDRGINSREFGRIIDGRLSELENGLSGASRTGILAAVGIGVALSLRNTTRVQGAVTLLTTQAAESIRTGLIQNIRDRLTGKLSQADSIFDRSGLKDIFDSARFSVAASAGLGWSAIFTALVAAGREQEEQTGQTQRVRWVLNDMAQHCAESPDRFGCPELEGVYNSWAELPTVPAALTTCRGNCRCRLEVETEPGSNRWVRGLPEFSP